MFLIGHFLSGEKITETAVNGDLADQAEIKQLEPARKLLADEVANQKMLQE